MLKALALTSVTEDQAEIILNAIDETEVLDITDTCRNVPELKDVATTIALCAVGTIAVAKDVKLL
ncbi:MAG: hypothetical protein HDT34_02805 [Clostridiales bacterium]|nr:hypothetical protein [Clostridiales bacterium]